MIVEAVTQGILLGFEIVPATAQFIIPISGMLIGNSMVLSILFLNRFTAEIEASRDQIELILSLGGTPKQAIHRQLEIAIRASMVPTFESQKNDWTRSIARHDERADYRWCGSHSSCTISVADCIRFADYSSLIEYISRFSKLPYPVQRTDAIIKKFTS